MVDTADALKGLVKVGVKLLAPWGLSGAMAAVLETGSSLLIDAQAARRAADVHGRVFRKVDAEFRRYATSKNLSAARQAIAIDIARTVIEKSGIRSGEWSTTYFSPSEAKNLVIGRAKYLLETENDDTRGDVTYLIGEYYDAVLADRESLINLEAEFRSTVLRLLRETSERVYELGGDDAQLIAGTLVSIPLRRWRQDVSPPGALLRADIDVGVPFHGRQHELEELTSWRESEQEIGLRLYVGPGGLGKTRLLIEACRQAEAAGWYAGFVSQSTQALPSNVYDAAFASVVGRRFFVIDYAETRGAQLADLTNAIATAHAGGRCRLVLLARHAGDWWKRLRSLPGPSSDLFCGPAASEPIRLRPVAETAEEKARSYSVAARTFAQVLRRNVVIESLDLTQKHFERILLLHMQALAAVEGVEVKGDRGLLEYVLSRERRFWRQLALNASLPPLLESGIAQAMAVATLSGGIRREDEVADLLRQLPVLSDQTHSVLATISNVLHEAYPGDSWIAPVLPDLLGEHLIQSELDEALISLVLGSPA